MNRTPFALALAGLLAGISAFAAPPASAQVVVVGSTVHERQLSVGGQDVGTIQLRNTSDVPQEVRLYQADYSFDASGESQFPDPGTHLRSNAGWITFTPSQLLLAPGEVASVRFSMTAPDHPTDPSTSLHGTFWSVLMVEGVEALPADPELSNGQIGIRPRLRFAVQLVSHIEGPASRDVELGEVQVTTTSTGERFFSFEVIHAGERGYRPEVRLHLYTEGGDPVEVFVDRRGLLYPGTSVLQRFDVSHVPEGIYEALITMDTGGPELFGAQVRATF